MIKEHLEEVLSLEGAQILFGGKPMTGHKIPEVYGCYEPTAVFVPLRHFRGERKRKLLTKEVFGPFQIVTEYNNRTIGSVAKICENMSHHLTAAIVSNDVEFVDEMLGATINGTTYHGLRARTTGAPQNHWFGPSGDPRGAGIGTPEAIQLVWSHHREIITDNGPVTEGWEAPPPA